MSLTVWLERRFRLKENGSSLRAETTGGLSTFMTLSSILFAHPAILSKAGAPFAPEGFLSLKGN